MFISNDIKNNIGKEFILARDVKACKGTIVKGSVIIVTNIGPRGYNVMDKDSGETIIECGFDCLSNKLEK